MNIQDLEKLINENTIKTMGKKICSYIEKIRDEKTVRKETIDLLEQSKITIETAILLLDKKEITDSATLMRSSLEKIMMGMMIYFDEETFNEFKNLKKCGKPRAKYTNISIILTNFSLRINEINCFYFEERTNDEIRRMLEETYSKLCLYTHSSLVVSMMLEVKKNDDSHLFMPFFYQMSDFLEVLLYSCLKFLCKDNENHIDIMCWGLRQVLHLTKRNDKKITSEKINEYKGILYWDINSEFNDEYNDIIQNIKEELKELPNLLEENKEEIINHIYELSEIE